MSLLLAHSVEVDAVVEDGGWVFSEVDVSLAFGL